MKTSSSILTTTMVIAGFAALTACGAGGSDPETPEFEAFKYRDSVMHLLEDKTLIINQMYREQVPLDEEIFVEATQDLAALANMMLDGFENQTLVPESRADPAIWENWDDFEARANNLIEGASALAEAASTGGFAAARGFVEGAVGTCGSCHNRYRADEE
jgi:cytochrome c556